MGKWRLCKKGDGHLVMAGGLKAAFARTDRNVFDTQLRPQLAEGLPYVLFRVLDLRYSHLPLPIPQPSCSGLTRVSKQRSHS